MKSAYYMAFTTWLCTAWWAYTLGHSVLGTAAILYAVSELYNHYKAND
jgi:hypothetical protein